MTAKSIDVMRCEKIPVKDRDNLQHMLLIEYYGGVREYLLSMGEFNEVDQ